jgi:hypothetical protein
MRAALRLGYASMALYVLTGAALWSAQARLIFEPSRHLAVRAHELPFRVVDLTIPVADSTQRLHAWWMPGHGMQGKLFLYFHGNDGNVSTSVAETALLRELGHSVLVIDYRGYGESDGRFPSERTMYEDAEAALRYARERLGADARDTWLYGHSLGAAVAIDLAAKHPELGGLIVESGFTSIYDMARLEPQYAVFPLKLLLRERFESIRKVPDLALPVLYVHGTADEVVPFEMGKALFARSGGRKAFVGVAGGRHEDNARVAPAQLRAGISELLQAQR